jgi:signal transduction histidine kinase
LLRRTIRYAVKHKQDRNELEDLYKQVRELEQIKTDMIRIAAHDLRTPLMTMLNYANFLRDDNDYPLQEYQQGYAENIIGSVRRMQQIIGDILSLERIQETASERYEGRVDFAEQVQQAVDACLSDNTSHQVEVAAPQNGIIVRGDSAQLREAATNMMTNAVKYTPAGNRIVVKLEVTETDAVFTVEDNGYGIPPKMQERLFSPFYRAQTKETRRIEGTGLGLHLVRNIVQRHSGEIIFHSVYGEGSTFGFKIPLLNG